MIDTPEKLAIHLLGKEKYDHSPCQAHPYELIAQYVDEQRNESEQMRNLLTRVLVTEGRCPTKLLIEIRNALEGRLK